MKTQIGHLQSHEGRGGKLTILAALTMSRLCNACSYLSRAAGDKQHCENKPQISVHAHITTLSHRHQWFHN